MRSWQVLRTRNWPALLLVPVLALTPSAASSSQRSSGDSDVRLRPRLVPGTFMRYQVQVQTTTRTTRGGIVQDPHGPSERVVAWDAVVHLEVLAGGGAADPSSAMRLRATYERSSATLRSDTPEPEAERILEEYARLEGRTMEFALDAAGRVTGTSGLDDLVSGEAARAAVRQWIEQLSAGGSAPGAGVRPGDSWRSERPANSLPLDGLIWRRESAYLRNEPCRPASPGGVPDPLAAEPCAVILTQLSLVAPRPLRDPTPDSYRRNGLRTDGTWETTGESLTYVSLRNHWVVSVTQETTQSMDVTVSRGPDEAARIAGTTTIRSVVVLLPPDSGA